MTAAAEWHPWPRRLTGGGSLELRPSSLSSTAQLDRREDALSLLRWPREPHERWDPRSARQANQRSSNWWGASRSPQPIHYEIVALRKALAEQA
jgi:hypothetical protein